MILYHCRDSRSLRPLWALEEAGIEYELVKMPFPPRYLHDGYLAINSLGTVPALDVDGVVMTESAAMCQLIAERSPEKTLAVHPPEPGYAAYLNWMHRSDATLTFPLTIFLRYSRLEKEEKRVPQVADDYRRWFLKRAESVEAAVDAGEYLCSDRFTMADITVGYALYLATKLGLLGELGPASRDYLTRLMSRAEFRRAVALESDMAPVL